VLWDYEAIKGRNGKEWAQDFDVVQRKERRAYDLRH
jgi:hypothetical protein